MKLKEVTAQYHNELQELNQSGKRNRTSYGSEEDANACFFQYTTVMKRNKNNIRKIKDVEYNCIEEPEQVKKVLPGLVQEALGTG